MKKLPNYTTKKSADGKQLILTLEEKSADGRTRSIQCPYPFSIMQLNETTNEYEAVRLNKKQTEKWLLARLGYQA